MVNRRLLSPSAENFPATEQRQQSLVSTQSELSQTLDSVLFEQALERRRHYTFGAANLPKTRPPESFNNPPRLMHIELLNTLRDFHILLLQQKSQLENLRCQIAGLHGALGKISYYLQQSDSSFSTCNQQSLTISEPTDGL